jgi:hypothetical protein
MPSRRTRATQVKLRCARVRHDPGLRLGLWLTGLCVTANRFACQDEQAQPLAGACCYAATAPTGGAGRGVHGCTAASACNPWPEAYP